MKNITMFFVAVAAGLMLEGAEVKIVRQQLLPGFDGKMCKVQPTVATDGKGTALMSFQKLLLSGSDVFYGQFVAKSVDGGTTWGEPRATTGLPDEHVGDIRITKYATVYHHRKSDRFFAFGIAAKYKGDKVPYNVYSPNDPYAWPLFVTVDAEKGDFVASRRLAMPFDFEFCYPFGQIVELENGDLLVPFYFRPIGAGKRSQSVVVRFAFDGGEPRLVQAGKPVAMMQLRRGLGEPSLARLGGKFYLTLRSDEAGMWCESDDGLEFTAPRRWTWTDGEEIGNRNTQQHWMKIGDRLYLAYTRVTPTNGHVFRNRAPIFLAEFDPKAGGLKRETERPIVPERGARLGNFCCTEDGHGGAWLITAEWMQPAGCGKYGCDNALWLVKGEGVGCNRGTLLLTFDDGHFNSWDKALPLFDRYGAHATFFVNGRLDEAKLMKMRTYQSYGHSVGLHGAKHTKAMQYVRKKGIDGWFKDEVEPQLAAIGKVGLEVRNFAYPMSNRDAATDDALKPHFTRMRTGHIFGRDPTKMPLATCDEAFIDHERLKSSPVLAGMGYGSKFPGIAEDLMKGLERLAERNEVLVLYSHDIREKADGSKNHTSIDVLEAILRRASELGIRVIGFDEI